MSAISTANLTSIVETICGALTDIEAVIPSVPAGFIGIEKPIIDIS
ncbi:hypothetical protein SDC9_158833 [bioreactor metagenome]|uniref:Uncharacterized protein n=1 Tax=bioreactor metagenome TaxID=1076179 RepID=A0A645FC87_9ZZZZ